MLASLGRLDRLTDVTLTVSDQASSAAITDMLSSLQLLSRCHLQDDVRDLSPRMSRASIEADFKLARSRATECQDERKRTAVASLTSLTCQVGLVALAPLSFPRLTKLHIRGVGRHGIDDLAQVVRQCPSLLSLQLSKLRLTTDRLIELLPRPPATLKRLRLGMLNGICSSLFRKLPSWAASLTKLNINPSTFVDPSELTFELIAGTMRHMPNLVLFVEDSRVGPDFMSVVVALRLAFPRRIITNCWSVL